MDIIKKESVLFVDDEESILNSLRRGLVDEEYECIFATNGMEALEILKKRTVCVIVSDMRMPGMDGLTLLKEVKDKYPKTVRIVLSGYAQLQQVLATVNQADVFKFISKPWKLEEEFKGVIRQALDYHWLLFEQEAIDEIIEGHRRENEKLLNQLEETIKETRYIVEFYSNIGITALDTLLEDFPDTYQVNTDLKDKTRTSTDLIKRKLETAAKLINITPYITQDLPTHKSLFELINEAKIKQLTHPGTKTFDIDYRAHEVETYVKNNRFIAALIGVFGSLFSNDGNNYFIKVATTNDIIDGVNNLGISIIVSNASVVDTDYLKTSFEQYQDACIEVFNPIAKHIIKLFNGTFQCARFETNVVGKINLPECK